MAYELEQTKTFDVNGQKYQVGIDEAGYVQIQIGELWHNEETGEEEFYAYDGDEVSSPHVMLDRDAAQALGEYVAELGRQ